MPHTSALASQDPAGSHFDLLLILYFKKIHNSITSGNNGSQSIIQNTNPVNTHSDQGAWIEMRKDKTNKQKITASTHQEQYLVISSKLEALQVIFPLEWQVY